MAGILGTCFVSPSRAERVEIETNYSTPLTVITLPEVIEGIEVIVVDGLFLDRNGPPLTWISDSEIIIQTVDMSKSSDITTQIANLATGLTHTVPRFQIICYDAETSRLWAVEAPANHEDRPTYSGTVSSSQRGYKLSLSRVPNGPELGAIDGSSYRLNWHQCLLRSTQEYFLEDGIKYELNEGDGSVVELSKPLRILLYSEGDRLLTEYIVPESNSQITRMLFNVRYSAAEQKYYSWDIRRGTAIAVPVDERDLRLMKENGGGGQIQLGSAAVLLMNADQRWKATNCLRFIWMDPRKAELGGKDAISETCIGYVPGGMSIAPVSGGYVVLTDELIGGVYWMPLTARNAIAISTRSVVWDEYAISPNGCSVAVPASDSVVLNEASDTPPLRLLVIKVC